MRRLFFCLCVSGVMLLSVTAVSAQEFPPLSLAEYRERLQRVQTIIQDMSTPSESQATLARAAADLDQIQAVVLTDGRIIPLHLSHLTTLLRAEEPDLDQIDSLINNMLAAEAAWSREPAALDEAALSDILSQRAFQYDEPEPNFIQRFLQDVRRRILDFIAELLPEGETAVPLAQVVTFLSVVALILILVYALRSLFTDFTAASAVAGEDPADGELLTADIALNQAQTHSAGGDYRTAVRYLYLSSLLLLEERDLLRYDRSLTNREYLRNVANHPRLAAILREVIDVFDRVWYGFQGLTKDEYDAYAQKVESLKKQREDR